MKPVMFVLLTVLLWGGEVEAGIICPLDFSESSQQCRGVLRYDVGVIPDACLATMEAAMRAVDEFVVPAPSVMTSYDGCNICTYGDVSATCTLRACTVPDEIERLEWNLFQAKARAATEIRRKKAFIQWEQAKKECWSML